MIDHVSIQCADFDASAAFYDTVLGPLGGRRILDLGGAIGYGTEFPDFWIGRQRTGDGFRESHLAFQAPSRAAVQAFFDAAVAAGAEVLHEPRAGRSTTPVTTEASCATPTATTSKRYITRCRRSVCHRV
jgi:catechol 2,3-dioxygenase-like lactoylglutathione lyase family enzyme